MPSPLLHKTFQFSIDIVTLTRQLQQTHKEFTLTKQLMRSGTSVGAMIEEARHAESKADFIHKLAIAQKEINETIYWLRLLNATNLLDDPLFESLNNNAIEILKMLTSSIKTTKSNLKKPDNNNSTHQSPL